MFLAACVASLLTLTPHVGQASSGASAEESARTDEAPQAAASPPRDVAALQARAWAIQQEVSRQRGIPSDTPVRVDVSSADELIARTLRLVEEEVGPERVRLAQRVNEMLGLLQPDEQYLDLLLGALGRQVAGFYDHREQAFHLLDSSEVNFATDIVEHELVHALQDLRWKIGPIMRPGWVASDVVDARSSLIEGDATLYMLQRYFTSPDAKETLRALRSAGLAMEEGFLSSESALPRFLAYSMISSYSRGLIFASSLYYQEVGGGWPGVDGAFESLPLSTEQLLYPERYSGPLRDEPTFLVNRLDASLLGVRSYIDIVGLLGIRGAWGDLLERTALASLVESATSGWDGDRLEFWESDSSDTLVWTLVFDSEDDARSFYRLSSELVPFWLAEGEVRSAEAGYGERVGGANGRRGVGMERWGDLVAIVIRDAHDAPGSGRALDRQRERLQRDTLTLLHQALTTSRRYAYPELFRVSPGASGSGESAQ